MRIISFANQKGGVGKTTTVQNVGAGLAMMGKRVLLVDLDPQGNLTEGNGIDPDSLKFTTFDLLLNGTPPSEIVQQITENLFILPANIELAGAEVALANLAGKDSRLSKALEQVKDMDIILIDCPPSLGQLTLNGLTAATEIIVPVQTEFYSYKGLRRLKETIDTVKMYTNPKAEISGIVCTFYRDNRNLNKQVEEGLVANFGDRVFKTKIRDSIKLAETPAAGQNIFDYQAKSQGADDYMELCKEILSMEGR